jgi:hypothetical protein
MDKITVLEYANIKGVSKQAVQQQISKGKLKAEKIDGQWFINEVPSVVTNPSTNQQANLGTNQQTSTNNQKVSADNQKELLDQLKSENEYLRNKLDGADEARTRSDTIIMQLTQQLERTQMQLEDLRETKTLWQRVRSVFIPRSV